jgi:hypothetical protein
MSWTVQHHRDRHPDHHGAPVRQRTAEQYARLSYDLQF